MVERQRLSSSRARATSSTGQMPALATKQSSPPNAAFHSRKTRCTTRGSARSPPAMKLRRPRARIALPTSSASAVRV